MIRSFSLAVLASALCQTASAASHPHPPALDDLAAHYAKIHGIPLHLVQRVIERESGYNPRLVHRRYYGLMQITYQSARSMGYRGEPKGLLDPAVNLTYAVPYLANAYTAAGGSEAGAIRLYSGGYYYVAKHKHLLGTLRTAVSPSLEPPPPPPPAPPPPPPNPVTQLLRNLTGQR